MNIKKHSCQIAVFFVNVLVLTLVILGIKNNDTARVGTKTARTEKVTPIDSSILEVQGRIADARESKLRRLNTSPKSLEQENITTTTITVAPDKKSTSTTKTADTTTKTS